MNGRSRWRKGMGLAAAAVGLLMLGLFGRAWWTVRRFDPDRPSRAAVVFDIHGELVGTVGSLYTRFVPLSQIPAPCSRRW